MKKINLEKMQDIQAGLATPNPCELSWFQWVALGFTNQAFGSPVGYAATLATAMACDDFGG